MSREYSLVNADEMKTSPKSAGTASKDVAFSTTSVIAASREGRVERAFAHRILSDINLNSPCFI